MRDLLAVLGFERGTVVRHSLGGGIAMQFSYLFPEYVERMALISSGGLGRLYLADQLPTMFIWGTDDPVIPVEHGRRAHEIVAHSRYVEIEGSGHWPMLDEPDRIVRELTDFIDETGPFQWSLESVRERLRRGPGGSPTDR